MKWAGMGSLFLAAALGGCATTSSAPKLANAQHFTGTPYDVRDEGNRVQGLVCGVSIDYTVARQGDATVLQGFSDNGRPLDLRIERDGNGRRIVGSLGNRTGTQAVDLVVAPDAIRGQAGIRRFALRADGNRYDGTITAYNVIGAVPATVDGRDELGRLPDEAVAAILPTLLNCDSPMRALVQPRLAVRLGGPPGYEPRAANQIR